MSEQKSITTPRFVIAFPHVFDPAPSGIDGTGPLVYSCTAIFDPSKFTPEDKTRWKQLNDELDVVSKEAFKRPVASLSSNFRKPFRDGAEKAHLNGFGEGKVFVNLKSKFPPYVFCRDGQTLVQDADEIYAGVICRATVRPYSFDKAGGKGLAFGLGSLKKLSDGDRLDGKPTAEQAAAAFGDLGEDDDF